jgi:hypothetical protein
VASARASKTERHGFAQRAEEKAAVKPRPQRKAGALRAKRRREAPTPSGRVITAMMAVA